ncbi:MAG TPA: 4-hydroxyphenylacetate 3-hydroxylase N-terminal domain-containing protein [Burkholderiales bacterium]|nr:4-hydroxyphenylacetate 3-hydroxylase N-terminal domain-containing protein [Burkholderiales bacterium]
MNGKRYYQSLYDEREVWLNGKKVDVISNPAFKGIINTLSTLYDLQYNSPYSDEMSYICSKTNLRLSLSYLLPKSNDDLIKKRQNSTRWAYESWGQLPRIPDFMSNVIVGLYDFRNELKLENQMFYDNVLNYYNYCSQNDIVLTHAIGDPQINRSAEVRDNEHIALKVIQKNNKGVIVRGAKQLSTLAPVSNDVFIYMSPSYANREKPEYVIWFSIPIATKGLKILCRSSRAILQSEYSSPFMERFDEQDAILFFDDVLVPWERVFLLDNAKLAYEGFFRINAWALFSNAIRAHQRLLTFLGLSSMLAKAIGIHDFRQTLDKLGELTSYADMLKLAIDGMQANAQITSGGLLAPADATSVGIFTAQISMRVVEIIREIAASGLIMHPSEEDLANVELRQFINLYMGGNSIDASKKSRLFRLAQDLSSDYYGLRQELYERWNRGDIVRNRINLYKEYDLTSITKKIEAVISEPLDKNTKFITSN